MDEILAITIVRDGVVVLDEKIIPVDNWERIYIKVPRGVLNEPYEHCELTIKREERR